MTTDPSVLQELAGGDALVEWFGRVPGFHDAELLEVSLSGEGAGRLRMHAWIMTGKTDDQGYFAHEKHAVVTLVLECVSAITLTDLDLIPSIILDLEIKKAGKHFQIEWSASYGVEGSVKAKNVRIILEPC